jgi:hypothetical protein
VVDRGVAKSLNVDPEVDAARQEACATRERFPTTTEPLLSFTVAAIF